MLDCQSCLSRCINAILLSQSVVNQPTLLPICRNRIWNFRQQHRSYAIGIAKARPDPSKSYWRIPPIDSAARRAGKMGKEIKSSRSSKTIRTARPLTKNETIFFTEDPKKLAQRAKQIAEQGDRLRALNLVRAAPSDMDPIVAWNYLIDHAFRLGDVIGALKTYNQMKKKSIVPSESTYSIIFSGLALNALKWPIVVERALKIYESLKAPKSPVKLNQTHSNALLHVLARAGAVDKVFEVATSLPVDGPDTITYTTIFQGLRHDYATSSEVNQPEIQTGASVGILSEESTKKRPVQENTIEDAKRIWSGILSRWESGRIILDEKLLCSYCRLLLASEKESHWYEALTVVEEILKVPNPITIVEKTQNVPRMKLVLPPGPRPGTPTASLLIEACGQLHNKHAAEAYWEYFNQQGVKFDLEMYNSYLRFLRKFRAGKEAADLMEYMVQNWTATRKAECLPMPSPKTFYIALSCCKRKKAGRTTLYPEALRILDSFEKMGLVEVKEYNSKKIKKYLGAQPKAMKRRSADDSAFIAKVYTMFLSTAVVLQDAMILKRALKRVTDPAASPLTVKPSPSCKISVTRKNPNPFLDLITCLNPALTSQDTKLATLDLVNALAEVVKRLLSGTDVSWGHGERKVLEENLVFMRRQVKIGLGQYRIPQNFNREGPADLAKIGGGEMLQRSKAEEGIKWQNSKQATISDEDFAKNWEPSSRKDSAKKRIRSNV